MKVICLRNLIQMESWKLWDYCWNLFHAKWISLRWEFPCVRIGKTACTDYCAPTFVSHSQSQEAETWLYFLTCVVFPVKCTCLFIKLAFYQNSEKSRHLLQCTKILPHGAHCSQWWMFYLHSPMKIFSKQTGANYIALKWNIDPTFPCSWKLFWLLQTVEEIYTHTHTHTHTNTKTNKQNPTPTVQFQAWNWFRRRIC